MIAIVPLLALSVLEGFGADAFGGQFGDSIAVTSLSPSGAGTLRECVYLGYPRVCDIRIAGAIDLNGAHLYVTNPFVTITGRNAPGPVYVKNGGVVIETHHVIIEEIAIRPGDENAGNLIASDGLTIWGPHAHDVSVDHVSVTWAADELVVIGGGARDITIQWSIIAQGLCCSRRWYVDGECHCRNVWMWDGNDRTSIHHNLIGMGTSRLPAVGSGTVDFRNNVIYQRAQSWVDPRPGQQPLRVNWVHNVYVEHYDIWDNIRLYGPQNGSAIWLYGNRSIYEDQEYDAISFCRDAGGCLDLAPTPFDTDAVLTSISAEDTLTSVLLSAGPSKRDTPDTAIIAHVDQNTDGLCDCITPLTAPDPPVCSRICGPWPTTE